MDSLETNSTAGTQQQEAAASTNSSSVDQAADLSTPEKVNAFQKFINGLLGGDKDEGKAEDQEKQKSEAQQPESTKGFSEADVSAAIEAARQKWIEEQSDAERIKKLSPEEAAKEEQTKKDAEIAELRSQILQKELKDTALADLDNDGFPVKLAELLHYKDKESMETSLATVKTVFKECLASAINERLRGKTPPGLGGGTSSENLIKEQVAKNIRGGM